MEVENGHNPCHSPCYQVHYSQQGISKWSGKYGAFSKFLYTVNVYWLQMVSFSDYAGAIRMWARMKGERLGARGLNGDPGRP